LSTPTPPLTEAATSTTLIPVWITNAEAGVKHWAAFIKAHEKILVIGLSAFLLFHFGSKAITAYDNHIQRVDKIASQAAISKEKAAEAQVEIDKANNAALTQQLAQLKATLQSNNSARIVKIKKAQTDTQAQIIKDNTLPMTDLAERWSTLLTLPPKEVTAANDGINVSQKAAQATVAQLETIPTTALENQAQAATIQDQSAVISKQDILIAGLDKQIADGGTTLAAEKASHATDVKALKSEIGVAKRKYFLKGFKWGFVTGVATTTAVVVMILK